jgi:ABC-type branched-subunit amino acid transport system ATPase component
VQIKNLSIENFRGFERLTMNGLGRINLIVGANNCGKTTVLEAINILAAHGDASAIWEVLNRRGEVSWVEQDEPKKSTVKYYEVRQLFRGFEIEHGARFQLSADTDVGPTSMAAEISKDFHLSQAFKNGGPITEALAELNPSLGLSLSWTNHEAQGFECPVDRRGLVSARAISLAARPILRNGVPLQSISSSALTPDEAVSFFGRVVLTPEEDLVVDALRIIEPTIDRIASAVSEGVPNGLPVAHRASIYVRLKGSKSRIFMGSMGDGTWHLLSLALVMLHSRDGILLVDDIDTGLHHTVMEDVWKFLHEAAQTYNVQVFATTHSRDCYEGLAAISRASGSDHGDVTIQRIERGREEAVAYSEQVIIAAAKHGDEVR